LVTLSLAYNQFGTFAYVDGTMIGMSNYTGGFTSVTLDESLCTGAAFEDFSFVPTPTITPEPSSLLLVLSSLSTLLGLGYRGFLSKKNA
jgi:hypothetical protein